MYPGEPRVGVGVLVFRPGPQASPEVLIVRRAKEPSLGMWSFPGGSLELGETLAQCAEREVAEETGIELLNEQPQPLQPQDRKAAAPSTSGARPPSAGSGSASGSGQGSGAGGPQAVARQELRQPTAFMAVDAITLDNAAAGGSGIGSVAGSSGRVKWHYVIVNVAAVARDPGAEPQAADDADMARYVSMDELRALRPSLTEHCISVAEEALRRFTIPAALPASAAAAAAGPSMLDPPKEAVA